MAKTNSKAQIITQFNSNLRVNEMLYSYGLLKKDTSSANLEYDPYETLRERTILNILNNLKPKSKVLDIGCGFGNLVSLLVQNKQDAYGIDLSEVLVSKGKEILSSRKIDKSRIFAGDFIKHQPKKKYDFTIANGVIWYYENRYNFLKKINQITTKDGETLVVHRNDLFNVLCFNNGTLDFLSRNNFFTGKPASLKKTLDSLTTEIPELGQGIHTHSSSKLKKYFDNPLTIHEMYAKAGFEVLDIQYLYIHPAPPRLKEVHTKKTFQKVHEKYSKSWQGMFMGSQFLVHAKKIKSIT